MSGSRLYALLSSFSSPSAELSPPSPSCPAPGHTRRAEVAPARRAWRAGWRRRRDEALRLVVLGARHRAAYTAHLLSLDLAARCNRFWCAVDDDFIRRYAQSLGRKGHILVGAMRGRRVVALAHVAPYPEGDDVAAEIGISVDAGVRNQGLGRRLLRAALEAVAQRRPGRVQVLFRSMNTAMAALVRGLGGRVGHDGTDACAVFEPTPACADARAGSRSRQARAAAQWQT